MEGPTLLDKAVLLELPTPESADLSSHMTPTGTCLMDGSYINKMDNIEDLETCGDIINMLCLLITTLE